jgi:hypothetical protein
MTVVSATIADEAALSGVVKMGSKAGAISVDGWDAAAITFEGSLDGAAGTFRDVYDKAGVEVTMTSFADAGGRIAALPTELDGIPYLKIRSGTSGTPVNQTTAAVAILITGGQP